MNAVNASAFEEMLPFYVNGTLSAEDRAAVEAYLQAHPEAQSELRWFESLQAKVREDVPPVSSEVGLERAMQRIRAEGPAPKGARPAAQPGFGERLRQFFASLVPQPVLKPALAAALAVVAVQAVVIGNLVSERSDDSTTLRAMRPGTGPVEHGPYLKLNFKPDAREADIRLLLVQMQGSLAAGPGQLGDYYVRVPEAQAEALADKVKVSPIVDGVAVVDALPAR
jgi:hypothetical protein